MRAVLLSSLMMLAGCREAPEPAVQAPPPDAAARPASVSPALIVTPAEVAALRPALDGAGVRLFNSVSGSSRLLAFDLPRAELVTALSAVLKARPVKESEVSDCKAHTASWANGLTVWFVGERFSGWSVQPVKPPLTTAAGIGLGSTRSELDAAYKIELVPDSTLGMEFTAGYLSGILSSGAQNATITHLWAGTTCIAR